MVEIVLPGIRGYRKVRQILAPTVLGRFYRRLRRRPSAPLRQALRRQYAQHLGDVQVVEGDGTRLVRYDREGVVDLGAYHSIQVAGNKAKIARVSVVAENIAALCAHLKAGGFEARSILCHGTRNGAEQEMFRQNFPAARVLGTEISDTATDFPDTIQWDFHDVKPAWTGAWDIVFSNSWDHTYDPEVLFSRWQSCVSAKGVLVLEHSVEHTPAYVDPLDPFGATVQALIGIIQKVGVNEQWAVEVFDALPVRNNDQRFVIARRRTR